MQQFQLKDSEGVVSVFFFKETEVFADTRKEKETVFIGQIADRIIAAGSIVFPILIQVSEVAGKRRNIQDIS